MWQSRLFVALLLASAPFVLESGFEAYGLTLAFGLQMIFFSLIRRGGMLVLLVSSACLLLLIVVALGVLATRHIREATGAVPSRIFAVTVMALSVHVA